MVFQNNLIASLTKQKETVPVLGWLWAGDDGSLFGAYVSGRGHGCIWASLAQCGVSGLAPNLAIATLGHTQSCYASAHLVTGFEVFPGRAGQCLRCLKLCDAQVLRSCPRAAALCPSPNPWRSIFPSLLLFSWPCWLLPRVFIFPFVFFSFFCFSYFLKTDLYRQRRCMLSAVGPTNKSQCNAKLSQRALSNRVYTSSRD